jgi:NAD(P)-dependent dehydrogenase (short-subunit alcohol dehydrogenase family)
MSARNPADLGRRSARPQARGGGETGGGRRDGRRDDTRGVAALVAAALSACGGIDVVVNNVGGSGARGFASTDDADRQAVLDRNPLQGELMELTRASGSDSTRVENLILTGTVGCGTVPARGATNNDERSRETDTDDLGDRRRGGDHRSDRAAA